VRKLKEARGRKTRYSTANQTRGERKRPEKMVGHFFLLDGIEATAPESRAYVELKGGGGEGKLKTQSLEGLKRSQSKRAIDGTLYGALTHVPAWWNRNTPRLLLLLLKQKRVERDNGE